MLDQQSPTLLDAINPCSKLPQLPKTEEIELALYVLRHSWTTSHMSFHSLVACLSFLRKFLCSWVEFS